MTEEGVTAFFGPVIHAYTRADALRDGVLVEIPSDLCREAGVLVPVAVTDAVWGIIDPGNLEQMPGQSVTGRTWDLVWMLAHASRSPRARHRSTLIYRCDFLTCREAMTGAEITEPRTVTLRAVCGPGDLGVPVITIMLPWED
jgi:hypothetical protein